MVVMPWYTPLHILYALVPVTTHFSYMHLDTPLHILYHYTLYMLWYTPHDLAHHYTAYMPWYIPLHTLNALVHTNTHIICIGCAKHNSTLHHNAQLSHPSCTNNFFLKKEKVCSHCFLNNLNSIGCTKLKCTVAVVGVLTYIHTILHVSMIAT